MSMFDDIRCLYPIDVPDYEKVPWQTKSLARWLERYEIRADGTIWKEVCDGGGVNRHWVRWMHHGPVEIHGSHDGVWHSVTFWFRDGVVADVLVEASADGQDTGAKEAVL